MMKEVIDRLRLLLPVLVLAGAVSAQPPDPPAFLQRFLRLSDAELRALDRGAVVTRTLPSGDKREVAAFGAVRVRATLETFLDRFRDIVTFKKSEIVQQIGRFGVAPSLDDLQGLTLEKDDFEALRRCRPGECAVRLSAGAIDRFRREIDWRAPDARSQVDRLAREMLLEYVKAYLNGGNAALGEYNDHRKPVGRRAEFLALLKQSPYLIEYAPPFRRYLEEFPGGRPENVEDFLYWSKEKFGLKPVVSVTHVAIYTRARDDGVEAVIASKQIYATHYFDASLGLTFLIPVPDAGGRELYMLYLNRTRSSSLDKWFSWMARSTIERRTREGMDRNLRLTKERLEKP